MLCYKVRMIEVRLKQLLAERERSRYWLSQESGIDYDTLTRVERAESSNRIELRVIDEICRALECQPGDLLIRIDDGKAKSGRKAKGK